MMMQLRPTMAATNSDDGDGDSGLARGANDTSWSDCSEWSQLDKRV